MQSTQLIDRLPMTVESLKTSKLGKIVVKLVKDPPTPGESPFFFAPCSCFWARRFHFRTIPGAARFFFFFFSRAAPLRPCAARAATAVRETRNYSTRF
jgi:hypothetical protein